MQVTNALPIGKPAANADQKKPLQSKFRSTTPTHKHCRGSNWRSLSHQSRWVWLTCNDYHGSWQAKQSKSGDIPNRHRCRMQLPLTEGLPTSHLGRALKTGWSLLTQVRQNLYKRTVRDYRGWQNSPYGAMKKKRWVFNITEDDLTPLLSSNTCIDCDSTIIAANSYGLDSSPGVAITTGITDLLDKYKEGLADLPGKYHIVTDDAEPPYGTPTLYQ